MTGFLPENPGVLVMDVIAEIRRRHFVEGETITSLAEAYKLSRPTSASISRRLQSLFISVNINPTRS